MQGYILHHLRFQNGRGPLTGLDFSRGHISYCDSITLPWNFRQSAIETTTYNTSHKPYDASSNRHASVLDTSSERKSCGLKKYVRTPSLNSGRCSWHKRRRLTSKSANTLQSRVKPLGEQSSHACFQGAGIACWEERRTRPWSKGCEFQSRQERRS